MPALVGRSHRCDRNVRRSWCSSILHKRYDTVEYPHCSPLFSCCQKAARQAPSPGQWKSYHLLRREHAQTPRAPKLDFGHLTLELLLDMQNVAESGVNAPSPRKNRSWLIRCLHGSGSRSRMVVPRQKWPKLSIHQGCLN